MFNTVVDANAERVIQEIVAGLDRVFCRGALRLGVGLISLSALHAYGESVSCPTQPGTVVHLGLQVVKSVRLGKTGTARSSDDGGVRLLDLVITAEGRSAPGGVKVRIVPLQSPEEATERSVENVWGGRIEIPLPRPGAHCIEVLDDTEDFVAPARVVEGEKGRTGLVVDIGSRDSVFLPFGSRLIPFRPWQQDKVIVLPRRVIDSDEALSMFKRVRDVAEKVLAGSALQAIDIESGEEVRPWESTTWRLRLGASVDADLIDHGTEAIERELPHGAALGVFVETGYRLFHPQAGAPGPPNLVLTNRYVVKLADGRFGYERLRADLAESKGRIERVLSEDLQLVLVSYPSAMGMRGVAAGLESARTRGIVAEWEAEMIGPMPDTAIPEEWPDDPDYTGVQKHTHHRIQRIREAWQELAGYVDSAHRRLVVGEKVVIGLLDRGVVSGLDEVECPAADGSPIVADCFDMPKGERCHAACGNDLDRYPNGSRKTHGIQMFGVAASCTDNGAGVAAVAPGARMVVVKRSAVADGGPQPSVEYGDMLLWMAGLRPTCLGSRNSLDPLADACAWPPAKVGARIVNASFSFRWKTVPLYIRDKVLPRLESEGALGRGTVLVLSAGNVEGERILPGDMRAHDSVLTVTNCVRNTTDDRDELWTGSDGSSWGEGVDLCALGQYAATVRAACLMNAPGHKGPCLTGGTSAAAATVSGVAALVLEAYPDATPRDVRDLLRCSADTSKLWLDQRVRVRHDDGSFEEHGCRAGQRGGSPCFGSGRLDAGAAVQMAGELSRRRESNPTAPACALWQEGSSREEAETGSK